MPFASPVVPVNIDPVGLYDLTGLVQWTGSRGDVIDVPPGFVTDLATVPRMFRALIDVAGKHDRAAIVHDRLCRLLQAAKDAGTTPAINPVDVDGIFRAILRELGVGRLMRNLYWAGVRWAAPFSYYRRAGWWRTLPRLLAVTLPLLVLLVPYVVVVAAVQGLLVPLSLLVDLGDTPRPAVVAAPAPPAVTR